MGSQKPSHSPEIVAENESQGLEIDLPERDTARGPEAPKGRDLDTVADIGDIGEWTGWGRRPYSRDTWEALSEADLCLPLPRPHPWCSLAGKACSLAGTRWRGHGKPPGACLALSAPDRGVSDGYSRGSPPPCTSPTPCLSTTSGVLLPFWQASPTSSLPPHLSPTPPPPPPPCGSRAS